MVSSQCPSVTDRVAMARVSVADVDVVTAIEDEAVVMDVAEEVAATSATTAATAAIAAIAALGEAENSREFAAFTRPLPLQKSVPTAGEERGAADKNSAHDLWTWSTCLSTFRASAHKWFLSGRAVVQGTKWKMHLEQSGRCIWNSL